MLLLLLTALQVASGDTVVIRAMNRAPLPGEAADSARYGPPQVRIPTRQGTALVWLVRSADTVFVAASMPDSTTGNHPAVLGRANAQFVGSDQMSAFTSTARMVSFCVARLDAP